MAAKASESGAPAATEVPEVVAEAPTVAPPRFVNPITKTVPLQYPVEYDGKVYTEVTMRRITAGEAAEFMKALATGTSTDMPPMIDGLPYEVWKGLDDDDMFVIDKAVMDFLPRRFRELGGETPKTGDEPSA